MACNLSKKEVRGREETLSSSEVQLYDHEGQFSEVKYNLKIHNIDFSDTVFLLTLLGIPNTRKNKTFFNQLSQSTREK